LVIPFTNALLLNLASIELPSVRKQGRGRRRERREEEEELLEEKRLTILKKLMQATIIVREDVVKDLVMPGLTTTQEPHHKEEMTTAFIHEETTSQQEGGTRPPGRGPDTATTRVCVHVSTNLESGASKTPSLEEPPDISCLQKRKEQSPTHQSPNE
jgi:hypothetical protein